MMTGGWRQGPAVSAGGGRGLGPALKEPLRVIAHIDMDAFYAQIEQLRDPALTGKPVVVVQYPTSRHDIEDMGPDDNRVVEGSASSIIAVSYEARPSGVKRGMKAADARKLCPELSLVQVPTRNGKADISLYRHAGEKVVGVLERAGGPTTAVEKASIDEVYVDVTRAAQALLSGLKDSNGAAQAKNLAQQQQQQQEREDTDGKEKEEGGAVEKGGEALSAPSGGGRGRGARRWEDIGEGGWAAVVLEATSTHIAGLKEEDDDDENDDDAVTKDRQASHEASWWTRPREELTEDEQLLGCGAAVVSTLRAAVRSELGYSCTAGLAHNKLLAKLCSNMHKPNAQTVLPLNKVERVFHTLPVERVRGWGGKFGVKIMEKLGVSTAGEVAAVGASELQRVLGDEDGWKAWEKANGVDRDPVKARSAPKSIGCSKTFPGKAKLTSLAEIERWLSELSKELVFRLSEQRETEGQIPSKLTVSFAEIQKKGHPKAVSRCCRMPSVEVPALVEACMKMVRAYKTEVPSLSMLGVSVHGFEGARKNTPSIQSFFGAASTATNGPGRSSGLSSTPPPHTYLPRKPIARAPSSSCSSSSSSSISANGLGFPLATATVVRRGVGVKRRRPWGHGAEGAGGAGTAVARRAEAESPDVGGADADDDDDGADGCGGGDRAREGISVDSGTAASDDRDGGTGGMQGAEGGTVAIKEGGGGGEVGGGQRRREHGGGGSGDDDDDVWCRGARDSDAAGNGEARDGATGEPEGGDDGVQFCGVVQVGGESSDLQAFEGALLGEWAREQREGRDAAGEAAGGEHLVVEEASSGQQSPGEARQGRSSSRVFGDNADANGQPHAMFGRGGASGVFGDVDPGVLAELPLEIQREIWMQQGGQGSAGSGQLQLRLSGGGKLPSREGKGGSLGRGGGRGNGNGRARGKGKGPRRREKAGGGGAQARRGSASISSFFGSKP
eukprot:g18843.t2